MPREQKQSAVDEVTTDTDTGLLVRGDPFGGNQRDLVGIAEAGEWEVLEEDYGPEIDWSVTPVIAGTLVAFKTVVVDHDDERGPQDTSFYGIENALTGERESFWGNYQIDKALQGNKYIGRTIYLEHKGKRDQSSGARTLNIFTILVKRPPVTD